MSSSDFFAAIAPSFRSFYQANIISTYTVTQEKCPAASTTKTLSILSLIESHLAAWLLIVRLQYIQIKTQYQDIHKGTLPVEYV